MSTHIQEYEEILEKEINSYNSLEAKIKAKKEHLIKRDLKSLANIDNEISNSVTMLNNAIKQRKEVSKLLGSENLTLKEIIEKTQNESQKRSLSQKRAILQKSAKNIERLNKVNEELIKQGLLIIEKSIMHIANAVAPATNVYNRAGQTSKTSTYRASSIIKEA